MNDIPAFNPAERRAVEAAMIYRYGQLASTCRRPMSRLRQTPGSEALTTVPGIYWNERKSSYPGEPTCRLDYGTDGRHPLELFATAVGLGATRLSQTALASRLATHPRAVAATPASKISQATRALATGIDDVLAGDIIPSQRTAGSAMNPASLLRRGNVGGKGVDLTLKYKAGWSKAQRAAADAKAAALTKADTIVTRSPIRQGSAQARYRKEAGLKSDVDADHIIDLQLSGADDILNMRGLNSSVNRSLGKQIQLLIKHLPPGTRVNKVIMVDP